MKIDPAKFELDTPPGKRSRRPRDEDAPKPEEKTQRKWTEREGYFQGAKVTRRK